MDKFKNKVKLKIFKIRCKKVVYEYLNINDL